VITSVFHVFGIAANLETGIEFCGKTHNFGVASVSGVLETSWLFFGVRGTCGALGETRYRGCSGV
jgi:hypothetical protein